VVGCRALLFVVSGVIALGGCGNDKPESPAVTASLPSAKGCASPAGNVAASDIDPQAIWPRVPYCTSDPAAIARSFATKYIGLEDPQIGEFHEDKPRSERPSGKIQIFRRGEDGRRLDTVVSTLTLRVLDDAHYWYVTSAQSPEVELTVPEPLAAITSPVTVQGHGRGFEGNVVIEVRAAYASAALADRAVTAGSMDALEPFSTKLTFTPPAGVSTGAIVAKSGSGIAAADGFAALPVRF
jgi:hypothetical protein